MIDMPTYDDNELIERILLQDPESYYDILGTSISVSNNELKKIYKNLVLRLHPDKSYSPNAQEAFQLVPNMYKTLNKN